VCRRTARPRLPARPQWEGAGSGSMQLIGFDMGGTSTDVSRYAGAYEHVFESTTAGVGWGGPLRYARPARPVGLAPCAQGGPAGEERSGAGGRGASV
jgi:hypothetical protein